MRSLQTQFAVRLVVVLCLVLGLFLPTLSPAWSVRAQAGDPPPPPAEDVQPPDRPSSDLPLEVAAEEAEVQAALDTLETARRQGPAAVLALRDTLRGKALDMAMGEIVAAHTQLARQAPPRPETLPFSEAEEQAMMEAQQIRDAANRAQALAQTADPANDQSQLPALEYSAFSLNAPTVDRTVGSGCTYATIASALSAASPGDRLLLEGGRTFTENLSIQISLTLQGGYGGCASASTARTTISAGSGNRVMYIYENLNVTLENLNIVNGSTTGSGGGIFVRWNTRLSGTNLDIHNNTSSALGGGVRLWGATATFSNTNIYDNLATEGAGVYGEFYNGYAPVLNLPTNADVYSNDALTGNGLGGGVYLREGTLSAADCSDIYNNNAIKGGGAYLVTSTLTIRGDCSEIMHNTATGDGGGIYAQGSTVNLDPDAELYDNTAGTSGTGNGGGAYLDNSDLWSDKALIYYNTADDYGGGVYATNSSLLDMDLGGYACTGPRCSQLSYNTATTLYGGGVYARDGSEVDLVQTYVENNTANYGGAVYATQSPVYLTNGVLTRNNATAGIGDGLRLYTGSSLSGSSDTLAYNDAGGAATGNAISLFDATLVLNNSIVWGHTTSLNDAAQAVNCSDVQGGYAGTGNLNVDPLFVAPASANLHLQSQSPVIDRCASGVPADADNDPRPVTYIRPATPHDMGADEAAARVGLNGATCAYGRIQDAVDAATSGATIQAASDVFSETVDIVSKNLTIAGGYDAGCTTYITGTTTVNGGGAGSVFEITDSLLMLRDLNITGGNAGVGGGVSGWPGNSRVTLDNTSVFGNQAGYGGGVYVDVGNVLTATNDSDVYNNTATTAGGGARVWGKFVGDETQSDVYGNSAPDGGGISVPGGTLVLNGSDLQANQATGAQGKGGGIHVYSGGVVTTTGNVWVYEGQAYDGAGIYADAAIVYMPGATVRDNIATHHGGGLYLAAGSQLAADGGTIGYAAANAGNEAVLGAGLYTISSTVNFDGDILNNVASTSGAGLYATGSVITLTNARVGGAGAYEANQLGATGHEGVGLFLTNNTHATLNNTIVSSNTFQTTGHTYGGGALVDAGSVLTLTNSRIERHLAPNPADGRGAGLYVRNATVTLDNSQIISNTAGMAGGGVRLFGGTLNVTNGSSLVNNRAVAGAGGAIAAAADAATPDINISNATLQANTAATDGGAIYLNAGTLDFTGWWVLRDNIAGGNGGAVTVAGTGVANFHASGAGSSILYNQAGGNGGALSVHNASTVQLYSNNGYLLSLGGNQADGHGGAAYADAGAYFDVFGRLVATANGAAGNGGVFYLAGGSRVWLDDYANDGPELRTNWAQNGGAIYASNSPRVECDGAVFGDTADGNHTTAGSGGAVYLSGSTLKADNCIFRNNQATGHGGAIAAYTSTLTIVASYVTALASPQLDRLNPSVPQATGCDPLVGQCSALYGNVADSDTNSSGDGGAIYANDSTLGMHDTYLHRNRARAGGAIYQAGASAVAEVANSLVYSNTVSVSLGAGIRNSSGAFTVTHATLANNPGGSGFSGVASAVYNTIAWGNGASGFSTAPITGTCNIDDGGNAGLATNPQFVAPGAGENYHLQGSSPAVNACATGLARDLDNVARPFGPLFDMGAFEHHQYELYLPLIRR